MLHDKTSKHVGTSTELTCLLPIKPGFLPTLDTRTYATRLRVVFKALQALRKAAREVRTARPVTDIVDAARTVHSFSWTIVEERRLLLNVVFDRPWEPYIRVIWRDLGPLLDLFLCNCEGFVPSTDDFEQYAGFVRKHQIETSFFYHSSRLSVDDQQYLIQFERAQREGHHETFPRLAATVVTSSADDVAKRDRDAAPADALVQWIAALNVLFGLRSFFPDDSPDAVFLHRAARSLLVASKPPAVPPSPAVTWLEQGDSTKSASRPRQPDRANVQGGILQPYRKVSHGCLLLARVDDPVRARPFIASHIADAVTSEDSSQELPTCLNVAFTANGLRHLGVSESDLARLPKEFREGMELRAGILGDVRDNHPEHWTLPEWNVRLSPAGDVEFVRDLLSPVAPDLAPDPSRPPVRMPTVDMAVVFHTRGRWNEPVEWEPAHPLFNEVRRFCAEANGHGIRVLSLQPLWRISHKRGDAAGSALPTDHFRYAEGISQPTAAAEPTGDQVPLGELLVGFRNTRSDDDFPDEKQDPLKRRESLLDHGSFLVVRKLRQHVAAFDQAVTRCATATGVSESELLAKLMGRHPDGTPLADGAQGPGNDFDFTGDPNGERCPFHAHIRRGNPRLCLPDHDAPPVMVPRIARRGLAYGPLATAQDDGIDRGMMFMAYNASIAEQFEIVQRWMSEGNTPTESGGTSTYGGQPDPILGLPDADGSKLFRFVDESATVRHVNLGPVPFVTLQWGLYLFAPSITALRRLAAPVRPDLARATAMVEFGRRVIPSLRTLPDWAGVIEDISAMVSGTTAAVYSAIQADHDGVLSTPYGVIVASHAVGMQVLTDDKTFSVSEYQRRFRHSVGEGHLGMDSGPEYDRASAISTEALAAIREDQAFDQTYELASRTLAGAIEQSARGLQAILALHRSAAPPKGLAAPLPLEPIVSSVLAALAQAWFDIPDGTLIKPGHESADADDLRCPFSFLAPSRYVFSSPHPRPTQIDLGERNGARLLAAVRRFVAANRHSRLAGTVSNELFTRVSDDDELARLLLGLVFGFVPTVHGTVLQVLGLWLGDETLWRVQQTARGASGPARDRARRIRPAIDRAMLTRPVPPLLHRTATRDTRLGRTSVNAGDRVVVAIAGMTQELLTRGESDVTTIFGGDRTAAPPRPLHACPGSHIARGVIDGMLLAILDAGILEPTPGPVTVRAVVPGGAVPVRHATPSPST